jgi:hypothetical protein
MSDYESESEVEWPFPLPSLGLGTDTRAPTVVHSTAPIVAPMALRGFVPRKRKLVQLEKQRAFEERPKGVDFVIENPLDGKLKDTQFMKDLLADYPHTVFQKSTSYCHYGVSYRKRTVLFTTLDAFSPSPPCPFKPCIDWRVYGSHSMGVPDLAQDQRNSLPVLLVDAEIQAWILSTPWATRRLFVDVFSGFGSVVRRVREKYPDILTYANDIVSREDNDIELDMRFFGMRGLLIFAFKNHFEDYFEEACDGKDGILGWLRRNNVALLLHVSCPCETYSTAAGCTHRSSKSAAPKSNKAIEHDRMNNSIVKWLRQNAL